MRVELSCGVLALAIVDTEVRLLDGGCARGQSR